MTGKNGGARNTTSERRPENLPATKPTRLVVDDATVNADRWAAEALHRRRDAAQRLEDLRSCDCEHGRHRDPMSCLTSASGPSGFGLTPSELMAEARRLRQLG